MENQTQTPEIEEQQPEPEPTPDPQPAPEPALEPGPSQREQDMEVMLKALGIDDIEAQRQRFRRDGSWDAPAPPQQKQPIQRTAQRVNPAPEPVEDADFARLFNENMKALGYVEPGRQNRPQTLKTFHKQANGR